jgi:hypothetical protein
MKQIATALVKAQKAYSPVIKNSTNDFFPKEIRFHDMQTLRLA